MMNTKLRLRHVLACLALLSAGTVTADSDFFRPAPDRAAEHDPAKVYPQGRIFPFSFIAAPVDLAKQAGVSLTGPWYGGPERVQREVEQARAAGIPVLYTIQARDSEGKPIGLEALAEADLDQAIDSVREQVRQVVESDLNEAVAWWYLQPEELRFWRKHEVAYLERASDAIRETDPQKRPVWMYDPGHRGAGGLARTAEHLDIVGKGMYTNYSSQRESRVWVRWTIEQELEAIRQANPDAIPIAVPEMFQQPAEEHLGLIPRWVRHDVYLSLVSGAQGVVVFSLGHRPNFPARMDYYEAYAQVSRELLGEKKLGELFLFGERRDDIRVDVTSGPAEVELVYPKDKPAQTYPSVSHLDVARGGERWLFLVNSANEAVGVTVSGLPSNAGVRVVEQFGEESRTLTPEGGAFEASLEPLEVKLYLIQPGS